MAWALLVAGRQQVAGINLLTRTHTHGTRTREPAQVAKPVQIPTSRPLPDLEVDWSDVLDKYPDLPNLCTNNDSMEGSIEDGDCILVTTIQEGEFIWASSTTLQCLAEAFHRNTEPKPFCNSIPTDLHDFEDVFSKYFMMYFQCANPGTMQSN